MDGDSAEDGLKSRKRSTRQTSQTGLYASTRSRLKRTRNISEEDEESRVVNGSKESKSLEKGVDDDGESPEKKQRLGQVGDAGDTNEKGDEINHGVEEMDEGENQDQEMNSDEEVELDCETSLHDKILHHGTAKTHPVHAERGNLESDTLLERRKSIHDNSVDPARHISNIVIRRSKTTTPGLSGTEERFPVVVMRRRVINENTVDQEIHKPNIANYRSKTATQGLPGTDDKFPVVVRRRFIDENTANQEIYKPNMANFRSKTATQGPSKLENQQETVRITKDPSHFGGNWNRSPHQKNVYQPFNYPTSNQTAPYKNTEMKFSQKPVISKASPVSPSRGWMWSICRVLKWCLILTVLLVFGFLVYHKFLLSKLPQTDVVHFETLKSFDVDLTALQAIFPSQRSEFWKRSGKHLKRHLQTVKPTEPVSVMLTAGPQAERTLGCLARRLATVFSAFHNASILEINGTTKRAIDSDQVKLEIDEALKNAFEGDKPAAVVHHFEELPPGSTLIFYRYCDHETAAYKNVFLVFTVMLSEDKIDSSSSLSQVEEMVLDYVKQRFITSEKSAMFNEMDLDKLSGLWSRISHVILPVAAEEHIEQKGCID